MYQMNHYDRPWRHYSQKSKSVKVPIFVGVNSKFQKPTLLLLWWEKFFNSVAVLLYAEPFGCGVLDLELDDEVALLKGVPIDWHTLAHCHFYTWNSYTRLSSCFLPSCWTNPPGVRVMAISRLSRVFTLREKPVNASLRLIFIFIKSSLPKQGLDADFWPRFNLF